MSTIWTACISLVLGFALLYICLFTFTIQHRSLIWVRLIIAPLAILCFWNFGNGSYQPLTRRNSSAMSTFGMYFIMRVLEHSIVGLWDPTPSHWVARSGKTGPRMAYPIPDSFRGRCFYAFDLLTSQRGTSWYTDREWNWTPRRLQLWTSVPSRQFVMDGTKAMIIQYLLVDVLDTITKSHSWDINARYPVSSLSVLEQSIFPMCVCGGAFLTISFGYTMVSTVCVLFGSSPDSWPPMFDSPFSSISLSDFWAHRWHRMFRRVFDRLSLPLVSITISIVRLTGKDIRQQEHIILAIRTIIIFWLSTLLHLFIMYPAANLECRKSCRTDNLLFWDPDILMFFMSQSLGIFIEFILITPVADWMFPSQQRLADRQRQTMSSKYPSLQSGTTDAFKPTEDITKCRWERVALTRLYTWMFLIWTGRWGTDMWVRVGFFREDEVVVPFSILRGLWRGKWWFTN